MVAGVPESSLLGVEAPLWSETVATMRDVEFLAFPRLAAIAEVGWSRAESRDWDAFKVRLGAHGASTHRPGRELLSLAPGAVATLTGVAIRT